METGQTQQAQRGFTLIEVILTIVIAAILGAMMVQLGGAFLRESGNPALLLRQDYRLAQLMEEITADYRDALEGGTLDAAFFTARDTPEELNNLYGISVDSVSIVSTAFQADEDGVNYTESGSEGGVQKVTITIGDQSLITLFTL